MSVGRRVLLSARGLERWPKARPSHCAATRGEKSYSSPAAAFSAVYAELFLTPASDPWLGLFAPDTYAALAPK